MTIKSLDDLFVSTLKDIYYAEKQILKALPGMVRKAQAQDLKKALETHRVETEGQVERLEEAFKLIDVAARGKKCEAMAASSARPRSTWRRSATTPSSTPA